MKLSELNEEHRIDAEYFSKHNLVLIKKLLNYGTASVENMSENVTDGIHTSIDYDENSRINLISATSPKENMFDLSRGAFISEKAHNANFRTSLKVNDVVVSTVGTIGNCAVVDESVLPANTDRHVGIIRLKNNYSPYVLSTFLLSKYGRVQTWREATGNVQLNLFIYKLKELRIPIFSEAFQIQIERMVKEAHSCLAQSKQLYSQAEDLLLRELGFKDWQPQNKAVSIKKFSDFAFSGRLDAEYYQSKYDEVEEKVKSYKGGYCLVSDKFFQNMKQHDFSRNCYNYIEIGDISVGDGSVGYNLLQTEELPANAKILVNKNDILISKVRPYRGAVAIINFECNDVVASGAFTVLHEKSDFTKETLQVLLRTNVYKEWLLKWNVGTSYPVIKDSDVLKLPIPLLPLSIQKEIASLVQKSFSLKAQSNALLQKAKQAVEEEIEAKK